MAQKNLDLKTNNPRITRGLFALDHGASESVV